MRHPSLTVFTAVTSVRDRAFTLREGLDDARRSLTGQMELSSGR